MKQNKNKIECTPTKHEEGAVKSLIQMSKETNAVAVSIQPLFWRFEQ